MCKILKKLEGKNVSELFKEYSVSNQPPINLVSLLEKIGIKLIPMNFNEIEESLNIESGSTHGLTFIDGDRVGIFYNKDDSENRRRFTVAHELAHCCLHTGYLKDNQVQFRSELNCNTQLEREANVFAGELLIPKEALTDAYNKLLVPSLQSLAKIFKVSTNVMAARLDYLDLPYFKDTPISEV